MAKLSHGPAGWARPVVATAVAAVLLSACSTMDRTRRPLFENAYYAPVDGQPRYIFEDPVGALDLTILQRLGRLDVAPPPPYAPNNDRYVSIRPNYDATRPLPLPVPAPIPVTPPVPVPPEPPTLQPPAPQPPAASVQPVVPIPAPIPAPIPQAQRRPVMPGLIQPQPGPGAAPSEPSVNVVPRSPNAPKPGVP